MASKKEQQAKSDARAADVLAGKGSLADRLRQRRLAMESGDPETAAKKMRPKKDK